MFGLSNQVVVTFKEENTMTFKHLFLKDYDESSDASFAVYTQKDVYEHIFYAVDQVRKRSMPMPACIVIQSVLRLYSKCFHHRCKWLSTLIAGTHL